MPNNPNPNTGTIRSIADMEIVDPHTIRFKTDGVSPYLPDDLTEVIMVSKKAGEGTTTEDFNSGKAAIGTGPYKVAEPFQRASTTDLQPQCVDNSLAFMFESRFTFHPTQMSLDAAFRQSDYVRVWDGLQSHFDVGER